MTTRTNFRSTGEEYDPSSHSTTYTAEAEVQPGHVVTRVHAWSDHFGPVRGSHHVEYTCTCGAVATGARSTGPHGSDLERLHHFADEAERAAFEAEEAARRERILRQLGGAR